MTPLHAPKLAPTLAPPSMSCAPSEASPGSKAVHSCDLAKRSEGRTTGVCLFTESRKMHCFYYMHARIHVYIYDVKHDVYHVIMYHLYHIISYYVKLQYIISHYTQLHIYIYIVLKLYMMINTSIHVCVHLCIEHDSIWSSAVLKSGYIVVRKSMVESTERGPKYMLHGMYIGYTLW